MKNATFDKLRQEFLVVNTYKHYFQRFWITEECIYFARHFCPFLASHLVSAQSKALRVSSSFTRFSKTTSGCATPSLEFFSIAFGSTLSLSVMKVSILTITQILLQLADVFLTRIHHPGLHIMPCVLRNYMKSSCWSCTRNFARNFTRILAS